MVENKIEHGQGDQQRCDCDYANNSGHTLAAGSHKPKEDAKINNNKEEQIGVYIIYVM